MKKTLFLALASMSLGSTAMAQETPDASYLRNSLYMMKLDMPTDREDYKEAFAIMDKAFNSIDFSKRYTNYNDFSLSARHVDFATLPTATQEEIDAIDKETKMEKMVREAVSKTLKEEGLKENVTPENEFAARLCKYFDQKHIANLLVAKWFGADVSNPATWNMSTIQTLGVSGLSAEAKADAAKGENLRNAASGLAATDKLLGNDYVCATRYGYMSAEEVVAMSTALIMSQMENLPAIAQIPLKKGIEKLASSIKGYFVRANAYLFQLDWKNGDTKNFYANYWNNGSIPANFIETAPYKLKYIGKSSKRAPATMSLNGANKIEELITRATLRGTDAAIAALQRDYQDFRPMSSLHVAEDGKTLIAYIGMKEGIKEGDDFDVFQKAEGEDGLIVWDKIGSVSVAKGGLWENREGAGVKIEGAAEDKEEKETESKNSYTIFKGSAKKMGEGCLIRLAGGKDKKKK